MLDVGAGLGTLSEYLFREFNSFTVNVEISPKFKLDNLVVADGRMLPFRDRSFEFSVSSDALEHVEEKNRIEFMRELLRCCKFGIAITYSKVHEANPSSGGIKIFETLCNCYPEWYLEHNKARIVNDQSIINALKENGAKVKKVEPLAGVFSLIFSSLQCRLSSRLYVFLLNIVGYLCTRIFDFPPYYEFGLTAQKLDAKQE